MYTCSSWARCAARASSCAGLIRVGVDWTGDAGRATISVSFGPLPGATGAASSLQFKSTKSSQICQPFLTRYVQIYQHCANLYFKADTIDGDGDGDGGEAARHW